MSSYIKTEPNDDGGVPLMRPTGTRRARAVSNDDDDVVAAPDTPQAITNARTPRTGGKRKAPGSTPKKPAEKEWNFTYMPASSEQRKKNGRVEGRNLITWNRPRMAEKLLLHIMYECSRHRVDIPWDTVAHRLHPGSTGGAIVQHLNRLRASLVAEGHLVPPICQKPGSRVSVDPHIRGYIRKFPESDDMTTTRPVRYDEPIEDRRFNLPDAWDTTFRHTRYDEPEPIPPPVESSPASRGSPAKGRGKPKGKKATGDAGTKREPSPDPAELNSDDDYSPGQRRARKQPRRPRVTYEDSYPIEVDEEFDDEEPQQPATKRTRAQGGRGRAEERSLSVTAQRSSRQGSFDEGHVALAGEEIHTGSGFLEGVHHGEFTYDYGNLGQGVVGPQGRMNDHTHQDGFANSFDDLEYFSDALAGGDYGHADHRYGFKTAYFGDDGGFNCHEDPIADSHPLRHSQPASHQPIATLPDGFIGESQTPESDTQGN